MCVKCDEKKFVHLHCHSEYSLLDGLSRTTEMAERAAELGQPAIALTDHGAMYGTIEFYRACKKAGVKPIIGMESYVAARGMADRDSKLDSKRFHALFLAENQRGYLNLLQLASKSQLEGYYYKPRVDHETMAQFSKGLISTTGCMAGEIPRAIGNGNMDRAHEMMGRYLEIYGRENFFIELQEHDIPELTTINKTLIEMAPRYGLENRFLVTNDTHYTREEDANPHEVLLCIQTSSTTKSPKLTFSNHEYYIKPYQQMWDTFKGYSDDVLHNGFQNSLLIAERCDVDLDDRSYKLPIFDVPEGFDAKVFLRHLCEKGLSWRYGEDRAENDEALQNQLNHELNIIHTMGFDTYFLIVWDLCEFARRSETWWDKHGAEFYPGQTYNQWKESDIWWNVRGSGAGSVVAYTLGITGLDPIENGLIFERFLNPSRVSMPDFDLDYPDSRRHEMVAYAMERYGAEKVAQIITFGKMKARAAVKDVGRAMAIPLERVEQISRMIPAIPGKKVKISNLFDENHEFYNREFVTEYNRDSQIQELIDSAQNLEGVTRHASSHAAGVIISDKPLVEYCPLNRPTSGDSGLGGIDRVTQWPMEIVESIGLLKVDFLGLSTLTIMRTAARLIEERHGTKYDMDTIPYDVGHVGPDPSKSIEQAFETISRGDTASIFQLEGAGMSRLMTEMKPNRFAHIIAAISLYRPGPMDNIPSYIERMHGREDVHYHHPILEGILGDTYGICVSGDALVTNVETGQQVRIDEVGEFDGFMIQGVDEEYNASVGHVTHWVDNGKKEVYEVTLKNEASVKVTADHKVLTSSGWKPINVLNVGDPIAIPHRVVEPTTIRYFNQRTSDNALTSKGTPYQSGVEWQEIVSIEPAGVERVYDLTVEGIHNFVANNIIVHNCVYQEQIIRMAGEISGYDPGEADMLRRAVSKKKEKQMKVHHGKFVDGAVENGVERETVETIWEDIKTFARYGFNKAHAADYAMVTCKTAFLKTHYPVEYMTAVLSVERDKTEKVKKAMTEARRMGIRVLPPEINESKIPFTIEGDDDSPLIRFGFGAIKNASNSAFEVIIAERRENGEFGSLQDLCERVDLKQIGKRSIEAMIKTGVFDAWGNRPQLLKAQKRMINYSKKYHEQKLSAQTSLFGSATPVMSSDPDLLRPEPELTEVERRKVLDWEKELIGLYLSEHPLESKLSSMQEEINCTIDELDETRRGDIVSLGGMISSLRTHMTKKGDPMAFGHLEDLTGKVSLVFFPGPWEKARNKADIDKIVVIRGKVELRGGEIQIVVDDTFNDADIEQRKSLKPQPASYEYPYEYQHNRSGYDEARYNEEGTIDSVQEYSSVQSGSSQPVVNKEKPMPKSKSPSIPDDPFGDIDVISSTFTDTEMNGNTNTKSNHVVVKIEPIEGWKDVCRKVRQMVTSPGGQDVVTLHLLNVGLEIVLNKGDIGVSNEVLIELEKIKGVHQISVG